MKNFSITIILLMTFLSMSAHEVRPAYFSITQQNNTMFQVVWKIPAMGNAIPKIYPVLPNGWEIIDEQSNLLPGSLRRTYLVKIKNGVEGNKLIFNGLKKSVGVLSIYS